jgi:hypothetical protein
MRTIVLVFSLIALAAPSDAAPKAKARDDGASMEQKCREMVGKEVGEGEVRSGINRHQVQRWSECMMGMPH